MKIIRNLTKVFLSIRLLQNCWIYHITMKVYQTNTKVVECIILQQRWLGLSDFKYIVRFMRLLTLIRMFKYIISKMNSIWWTHERVC